MYRLLIVFLITTSLRAQTPVPITIQNPSFEQGAPIGSWNFGPIPGWIITGSAGQWQPAKGYFPAIPDGATIAFANGGKLTQDLGVAVAVNTTYTLTVSVGHRADNLTTNYTISLGAGGTILCTQTTSNASIPIGIFAPQVLTCPVTDPNITGNLTITLSSAGVQADFDAVTLVATPIGPPPPLQIAFPGFVVTFPIANANQVPTCTPADGTCTMKIQVCDNATPQNCLTSTSGTLSLVKIVSLPEPATITYPIAVASNP